MSGIRVVMQQGFNKIVLGFRDCREAGKFMDDALDAAGKAGSLISFTVEEAVTPDGAAGEAGGEDA